MTSRWRTNEWAPQMPASHLTVEVNSTLEQFEALAGEWRHLFARCPESTPFLSFDWNRSFCDRLTEHEQLHLFVVREQGELVGIGPFKLRRQRLGCVVLPLATGVAAYFGFLVAGNRLDVAGRVAGAIAAQPEIKLFYVPFFKPDDVLLGQLASRLGDLGFRSHAWTRNITHAIGNSGGFEVYLAEKSARTRHGLRREHRKLAGCGPLSVDYFSAARLDDALLDRLAEVQRRSWHPKRYGIQFVTDAKHKPHHLAMARAGLAEVFLLSIDGVDSAFVLNYFSQGVSYAIVTAFLESRAAHSPGKFLWHEIIRQVLDRGDRCYDLLFGNAGYKRFWCNQSHDILRLVSWRGLGGGCLSLFPYRVDAFFSRHEGLKQIMKAAMRRLPVKIEGTHLR